MKKTMREESISRRFQVKCKSPSEKIINKVYGEVVYSIFYGTVERLKFELNSIFLIRKGLADHLLNPLNGRGIVRSWRRIVSMEGSKRCPLG